MRGGHLLLAGGVLATLWIGSDSFAANGQIRFEEHPSSGVDFVHFSGRSASKHVPETMGSGAAWIDVDRDGYHDLYLVDSGVLPGVEPLLAPSEEAGTNRLFRGGPSASFERVAMSGLEHAGYGMGIASADYDADGWPDVFVTNLGEDALFRNNGDGTFEDVSALLPADGGWGASAAWGDLDGDGWVDLYVTNYLHYPIDSVPLCMNLDRGVRQYCPPQRLDGVADQLFRNLEGAGFRELTADAGMDNSHEGKGLGVVIVDLTGDGLADVYVANDSTRNFLYVNRGDMTFEDIGLLSGTGLNDAGQPQSGMGVDVGDLDGDGRYEIGVTNFQLEPINLYRPGASDIYMDSTFAWGVGDKTIGTLGFGLVFLDADGDGDLDIVVANGHVLDDQPNWAQPTQVFRNERAEAAVRGDTSARPLFVEVTDSAGPALTRPMVSRGLAVADYDHDGAPDLAITSSGGPTRLLRNRSVARGGRLVVRLRGAGPNRDAIGAVVDVEPVSDTAPALQRRAPLLHGSSYLSQNSADLYFGLGDAPTAELTVTWPDGSRQRIGEVDAGQLVVVKQGRGLVARRPLARELPERDA